MNNFTKAILTGYRNIKVIKGNGQKPVRLVEFLRIKKQYIGAISRSEFFNLCLMDSSVDLLIFDIDSIGINETSYLLFLATCFSPATPVVLLTSTSLSDTEQRKLRSSQVLEVIQQTDSPRAALSISQH